MRALSIKNSNETTLTPSGLMEDVDEHQSR